MKNLIIKNLNTGSQKGFTMIELLVSVSVFTIVGIITSGIFVQSLDIQRTVFEAQHIQENALAVLELMAKEIRTATIPGPDTCTSDALSMTVYDDSGNPVSVNYSRSEGSVLRQYDGVDFNLSSNEVTFNSLIFCVQNSAIDDQQTRVTIAASISNRVGRITTVNLQTTIVSRDISLELQN